MEQIPGEGISIWLTPWYWSSNVNVSLYDTLLTTNLFLNFNVYKLFLITVKEENAKIMTESLFCSFG